MAMSLCISGRAATAAAAGDASAAAPSDTRFVNHGVLAPVAYPRGVFATNDDSGRPLVVAWIMDYAETHLLVIDAITGETQALVPPGDTDTHGSAMSPFYNLISPDNKIYTAFNHYFYEFDINSRTFTQARKIDDNIAMGLALGPQGKVYLGTYPNLHLIEYDPQTETLTDFGPLKKETWKQYPSVMATDREGWVYLGVGRVEASLLGFNPATREIVDLFPDEPTRGGYCYVHTGTDGVAYAQPYRDGPMHRVLAGKIEPIDRQPVATAPTIAGSRTAVLGRFADGGKIERMSVPDREMLIRKPGEAEPRRVTFDYPSKGARIMSIIKAPDGKVYASSGLPLRWARFDPETGKIQNRSIPGATGHLNEITEMGGDLYGVGYSGTYITRIRMDESATPPMYNDFHVFTNKGMPNVYRPMAIEPHIDGRHLLAGGTPLPSEAGGGLMIFDTQTGERQILTHQDLVPNHSVMALGVLPDGNVVGGTTTRPAGGRPSQDNLVAEVWMLDWQTRKMVSHTPLGEGMKEVRDLWVTDDGQVIGVALKHNGETLLFRFDPTQRRIAKITPLKQGMDDEEIGSTGLQAPSLFAQDDSGKLFVMLKQAILQVDPKTLDWDLVAQTPVSIHNGFVLHDGRMYFTHNAELWSFNYADASNE